MNIGNAAAPAATVAPAAPLERSRIVRILVLVDCVALVLFGFITFITNLLTFSDLTIPVLALYMCLFGLILSASEMNFEVSKRYFGALHEWLGEAVFMIFVGTLGIAIWTDGILAIIAGFYSVATGIAVILDQFPLGRKLMNRPSAQPTAAPAA